MLYVVCVLLTFMSANSGPFYPWSSPNDPYCQKEYPSFNAGNHGYFGYKPYGQIKYLQLNAGNRGYYGYKPYGQIEYPQFNAGNNGYTPYGQIEYPKFNAGNYGYKPYGKYASYDYSRMPIRGFIPFNSIETEATNPMMIRLANRCQETTEVMPKIGRTLKIEGYVCRCKYGYYLPEKYRCNGAFYDSDIKEAIAMGDDLSRFRCLPCKNWCAECVNEKICIKTKPKQWYGKPG